MDIHDLPWYKENIVLTNIQKTLFDDISRVQEQTNSVLNESNYLLVRSAAGSGKTTVLLAKMVYLLMICGYTADEVLYLSFNKKNVTKFRDKLRPFLKSIDGNNDIEELLKKNCRTFHSLALHIIELEKKVWPCILEPVEDADDEKNDDIASHDHNRADVYLSTKKFINEIKGISKQYLINSHRQQIGAPTHKYVSYFRDRYNIPGSCRSATEKFIFEFLAKHDVDFAYEEPNLETRTRPDFTFYKKNEKGEVVKYYYEHFGLVNGCYRKNEDLKKKIYSEKYGDHFLSTDIQDYKGLSIDSIYDQLTKRIVSFLNHNHIHYSEQEIHSEQSLKDKLFINAVQTYREVRDTIIETGQSIAEVQKRIEISGTRFEKYYMKHVFSPIEQKYKELLSSNHINTDFAECMKTAATFCKNASLDVRNGCKYKYILVDEYQDISQARFKLLKGVMNLNPDAKLIAVGDGRQSIYSFAGSDLSLFTQFTQLWGKQASIIDMGLTFRFRNPLLSLTSGFINSTNNTESFYGNVYQEHKASDKDKTHISIIEGDGRYRWVMDKIRKVKSESVNSSVLVLFRFNQDKDKFINIFRPFSIRGFGSNKDDSVTTLHKAKGAQADYVFIMECIKGSFPYVKDYSKAPFDGLLHSITSVNKSKEQELQDREDEERRLFYVALTRAKKEVFIMSKANNESQFVAELLKLGSIPVIPIM